MSTERPTVDGFDARRPDIDPIRERLDRRLDSPRLEFPPGWTTSGSWHRAQAAPAECGPVNAAEFNVLMGYADSDELGDRHRVLFAIYDGDLVAECNCEAYRWDGWCAHVALLWWRWSRDRLAVTDLDTGQQHTTPPWWLDVPDADAAVDQLAATNTPARTDGGEPR